MLCLGHYAAVVALVVDLMSVCCTDEFEVCHWCDVCFCCNGYAAVLEIIVTYC